jgi:hypothetical protein
MAKRKGEIKLAVRRGLKEARSKDASATRPHRLQRFPHPLERRRPDIPILKEAKAEYAKLQ